MNMILLAFIISVLIVPVYGQQSELDEMNEKGLDLIHQSKYDEAIQVFDEIIKLDPNNLRARLNKGSVLDDQGKYNESLVCINEGIKLAPKDPLIAYAWNQKANFLRDHGNYTDAIEAYNESIRLDPDLIGWTHIGLETLVKWAACDGSISSYIGALAEDSDSVDRWLTVGYAMGFRGEYEDAIKCFDKAIRLDPNSIDAWCSKSIALEKLGRETESRDALIMVDMIWFRQPAETRLS